MLSQNDGPSDENDRTREPLLGSLAGFAFVGLILFALGQNHADASSLPAQAITPAEQATLRTAAENLKALEDDRFYVAPAAGGTPSPERVALLSRTEQAVEDVVGVSPRKDDGAPAPARSRTASPPGRTCTRRACSTASPRPGARPSPWFAETAVNDPRRGPRRGEGGSHEATRTAVAAGGGGRVAGAERRQPRRAAVRRPPPRGRCRHLLWWRPSAAVAIAQRVMNESKKPETPPRVKLAGTLLLVATSLGRSPPARPGTVAIAHRRGTAA